MSKDIKQRLYREEAVKAVDNDLPMPDFSIPSFSIGFAFIALLSSILLIYYFH